MIIGQVINIENGFVTGWCYDDRDIEKKLLVTLYVDGRLVAEQVATVPIQKSLKGGHPTGNCGFRFSINDFGYLGQPFRVVVNGEEINSKYKALLQNKANALIDRIQIYGERASGTNFLAQLLTRNLPNIPHTSIFGWKHFFPPEELPNSEKTLFIVIFRDPFDWIRSLSLQPHHAHKSLRNNLFPDFIRKEWYCVFDEKAGIKPEDTNYGQEMMFERNPNTGKRFENVVQLRNAKNIAFLKLKDKVRHIEFVKYEDLLADPDGFLKRLVRNYNVYRKPELITIDTYKGITSKKFSPRQYNPISEEDLVFILSNLNLQVEMKLGYGLSVKEWRRRKLNYFRYFYVIIENNITRLIMKIYERIRFK
jgi:hypothetical protein